ncbi:hypothetical protein B0H14DRAFT_3013728, partial [Mycena olivaceomarginata]
MDQLLGLLVPDDEKLQERLRNMFDVAARIGHQQRAKEIACAREEGYEAGRQEGWRECQAPVTETETHSPSPLSRSLCAVGTQTDAVTVPASPVPLNWAEDAEALPIPSPHPPLTPPTPRDFSALCTGISRPQHAKSTDYYHYPQKNTPHSHSTIPFHRAFEFFPVRTNAGHNWIGMRDPRLRDLGRALAALGL